MEDPLGTGAMPPPPPTDSNGMVTVQRKMIEWVDGNPTAVSVPILTKQQIADIIPVAMSLMYEPVEGVEGDEQYQGMTNAEVMKIKFVKRAALTGDEDLVTKLWNRNLGMPKQSAEVLKVTATYEDYLKGLAEREEGTELPQTPSFIPVGSEVESESVDTVQGEEGLFQ